MKALQKVLNNRHHVVFLDLEGTQYTHEIIAIGAIKCEIDNEGNIIKEDDKGFLVYVKPTSSIGHIIQNMTNISEAFLKEKGLTLDEALVAFQEYVNMDFNKVMFITFGSNDARMVIESEKRSHPLNDDLCKEIIKQTFDFLAFISRYIRDENNNTYSLVNYLNLFNAEPYGISHNPLHDAIDLKNLYKFFITQKDVVKKEYLKTLNNSKLLPDPIKNLLKTLEENGNIRLEEFISYIDNYLE